ncbi:MAG TPA: tetratricopeptide repeat protein [Kofleriaceae bacterium]
MSEQQQHRANVVFAAGNDLFAKRDYPAAVKKYRESLELWDHPLVRFNLAVTLIRMDRVLEAADELDRALAFGDKPFSQDLYQQALDYQKLVGGRVGELEVSCPQPGTHVLLDGKPWFDCPGTQKARVLAGEHALVGEKPAYVPSARRVVVSGGATTTEAVELVAIENAIAVSYPYPRWIGWTIIATGAAVAIAGGAYRYVGGRNMEKFETDLGVECPQGCDLGGHPGLQHEHDSARLEGQIGIGLAIAGGGIVLGGILTTVLDRPRRTLPNLEIAPARNGATMSMSLRF